LEQELEAIVVGLEPVLKTTTSVNELIDTAFGCYPSSKSAGVVPNEAPIIWQKSTACHLAHALKML
jgi:hypothetical protein